MTKIRNSKEFANAYSRISRERREAIKSGNTVYNRAELKKLEQHQYVRCDNPPLTHTPHEPAVLTLRATPHLYEIDCDKPKCTPTSLWSGSDNPSCNPTSSWNQLC